MARQIQGVSAEQEISRKRLLRDTRPLGTRVLDGLGSIEVLVAIAVLTCATVAILPAAFDVALVLSLAYGPIALRRREGQPFRIRRSLGIVDPDDLHPGTGKPLMARGIAFFGNRKEDNAEIWLGNEDLRTHMFVLGSTGAGKTELLTSLAVNALNWASGFTYIDGKGDVKLWGKVFRMMRERGREDELFVINYMTGNADTTRKRRDKLSNTYNPFTVGNASSLIQLLVSLMDSSDGKGDMWKGRAISFISSVLPALTELRDKQFLMLHIGVIREYLPFPKYIGLMNDPNISDKNRQMMQAFLFDVPGYKFDKGDAQSSTFLEQFGYQQMQFTRVLSSLADTYGHIYQTPLGEVDFKDIVLNRRVLLVLLPALETSRPELANLGKIVVAAMKRMMGSQLGSKLEGNQRELLDSRATNSPTPYLAIFDEFGYFMPEDAALMWAQARSLGFALVAAGQDLQAFFRTSREETMAIVANSNTKVFGRIEDPNETLDLVLKRAGEAYVTEMGSYEMTDGLVEGYRSSTDARHTKVNRIDLQDLVSQIEGEVHMLVQSKLIRARVYYAVPEEHAKYEYRVNRFVRVLPPSAGDVSGMMIDVAAIMDGLRGYPFATQEIEKFDGAIRGAEFAARHSTAAAKYRNQRQGTEFGITLFVAAVDGLGVEAPPAEEAAAGGAAGGLVHTPSPTPAVSPAIPENSPEASQTEAVDPKSVEDDRVFDGASVVGDQSVSAFGFTSAHEDRGFEIEAAMFAEAAGALVYSAGGADSRHTQELAFLDEQQTATALRGIAQALGADPATAAAVANQIADAVRGATQYPAPPTPPKEGMEEQMDEALRGLDDLLRQGSS